MWQQDSLKSSYRHRRFDRPDTAQKSFPKSLLPPNCDIHSAIRNVRFTGAPAVEEADELLVAWRCMLRPITVPSRTLMAANKEVVRCRL